MGLQRNSPCDGNEKKSLLFYWILWVDVTCPGRVTNLLVGILRWPKLWPAWICGRDVFNSGPRKSSGKRHRKASGLWGKSGGHLGAECASVTGTESWCVCVACFLSLGETARPRETHCRCPDVTGSVSGLSRLQVSQGNMEHIFDTANGKSW